MSNNYTFFSRSPLINIEQEFLKNITDGPFFDGITPQTIKYPQYKKKFLGYTINSPLGVPACPITATSKGIQLVASLGFSVITCKTIRSVPSPVHPSPNIVHINNKPIDPSNIHDKYFQVSPHNDMSQLAIANSIGNPSFILENTLKDMAQAIKSLQSKQIIIASIFGDTNAHRTMENDFAYLAAAAKDIGFHAVEANFSCPNIHTGNSLYLQPDCIEVIIKKMMQVLNGLPLIIKIGYIHDKKLLEQVVTTIAHAGAQGICAINSMSKYIVNKNNKPVFPGREKAGVSGIPIQHIARNFIRAIQTINASKKLNLTILGTGGITLPEHFDLFFDAGADIAMSATGTMWDPYLALRYYDYANTKFFNQSTNQIQQTI